MSIYPLGKLPAADLARLLKRYAPSDPRLVIGGAVGEDAAVIEMGDRYLVATTDPITFATNEIGWYAVNINANDIACTGAAPRWFLATLLLPENKSTPELVERIFEQISSACAELGITLAGGHTEITYGLDRPIVIGQMLGEVPHDKLVTNRGARVGDDLILTKGIAVEATAIIAREKRLQLLSHFNENSLDEYANFLSEPGISVVKDATIAVAAGGVHAMHDPTEGGVATGLHEMAQASQVGLEIFEEKLPYLPETVALCQHFKLNPLGVIASGSLLIAADPSATPQIVADLERAGINASVIGRVQPVEQGCWLVEPNGRHPLPTFARDEITRLFE
ncbi:MAG: AIR synthase family protein [Anaerolineae bacterium]|nr:AIR synthase family protein [Anaerolineae bacterium]